MQGFVERKAEKLVRVSVDYTDRINGITISGDFFIHPEESLEMIEKGLIGLKISHLDLISEKISSLIEYYNIQLVGITPRDIESAIKEAVR